jgi:hypothetical protein
MTATMEIIFGKPITTPPTEKNLNPQLRYPFIIKFDGDIRRYQLVADAHNPNNLYIDEMNGIHIDASFFNNTLFSEFTVLNSTIYSSYKFFGDSIQFTLTSQRTQPKSQNKDTLQIVPRFPFNRIKPPPSFEHPTQRRAKVASIDSIIFPPLS